MPAGIQIVGDHGITQIDENTMALTLLQTGIAYAGTDGNGANPVSLSVGGVQSPILAIRPLLSTRANGICVVTEVLSGGTATWRITASAGTVGAGGTRPCPFQYYVFDRCRNVPAAVGLTVWRGDGVVCFSSDQRPMCIVAGAAVPNTAMSSGYVAGAVAMPDPSRTYAAWLTAPRGEFYDPSSPNPGPRLRLVEGVYWENSQYVTFSTVSNLTNSQHSENLYGGMLFLIDVTNI